MVAITVSALLTLAVSSAEVGHVYYAYRQLVTSTDAATLAGAQAMSDALTSTSSSAAYTAAVAAAVDQYSSMTGELNASSFLANDSVGTPNLYCANSMTVAPFYVECQTPAGSTTAYNAITVTQTAKVNLWFGGLIGMPSMNLSATASAAMKGGQNTPYNLAVIMDTTGSMANTIPHDSDCTTSQIVCAVQGLEVMLENMDPCAQNTTCTSSTPFVDDVALFVFPAPSTTYNANNYHSEYCGSGVHSVPYNFVNVSTSAAPAGLDMESTGTDAGEYEIIPFNDTYKTSDTSGLAVASALAEAVGAGSGCAGLSAPGGQGTYYAQVINYAQAQLVQQQIDYPASQNIMIILSDGDATACNTQTSTGNDCTNGNPSQIIAQNCPALTSSGGCTSTTASTGTISCPTGGCTGSPLNGTGTSTSNPEAGTGNNCTGGYHCAAYPSALGECGQAVYEAQQATEAGTVVYTIGFGSETTGCTTDQTYTTSSSSTYGAEAWPSGQAYSKTPCNAIAAMASNVNTFFSDNSGGCPALSTENQSFTSLAQIFEAIVTGLGKPRLIPNGTT